MPGLAVPTVAKYQDISGNWGNTVSLPSMSYRTCRGSRSHTSLHGLTTSGQRAVRVPARRETSCNCTASPVATPPPQEHIGTLPGGYRPPLHVMCAGSMGEPNTVLPHSMSTPMGPWFVLSEHTSCQLGESRRHRLLGALMPGTFVPDPLLNPKLSAAWGATVATAVTELQQKAWITCLLLLTVDQLLHGGSKLAQL